MTITAAEIMTAPAICIGPSASLAEAASLLAAKHISALPVVGPDGALVGIVSEADILRPFRESARLKRDWWMTLFAEGEALSQTFLDYLRADTRPVADVMHRQVITAEERMTLPQLAEIMTARNVKRLPVMRERRVAGIVSRADLIAALARSPAMLD